MGTENERQQAVARLKTMNRRRGKTRKPIQADTQTGGESPVPSTSGEAVTEAQDERQSTTA
jgi:hypothetical protein